MVGFAVVAPKFTPDDQNVKTMRTMCTDNTLTHRNQQLTLTSYHSHDLTPLPSRRIRKHSLAHPQVQEAASPNADADRHECHRRPGLPGHHVPI